MVKGWRKQAIFGVALVALSACIIGVKNPVFSATESKPIMELTVYNQDLALVKERRMLNLVAGISQLSFTDVAALIDPSSVKLSAPAIQGLRVLEQNYEYDIINDVKLLQKYIGLKIKIKDLKGEVAEGFLLNAADNVILSTQEAGGEVRIVKANQIQSIVFPEVPNGLITKPTLVWLLQNPGKEGQQPVEVSYLTGGLSWKADYIATINASEDRVDLSAWVTLDNQSGTDYKNARLKLVAGDVNRVAEDTGKARLYLKAVASELKYGGDQEFKQESFFEYHLYTLNRITTLKNNQIKQIELQTANSVAAKKQYIYEGAVDAKKVKTMLEFKNSAANNLGMPLPQGRIRVQKADSEGSLQFVGEDRIDHTPKDEKVRVYLGNAFDIVGERVISGVKEPTKNTREESYRITLRNHKQEAVTVTAVENMSSWNEWKIISNSHSFAKTEAGKAEFIVNIPADGEVTVTYTVRYKN